MGQNNYDYMIEILTALKDGKTIQVQSVIKKDDWINIKIENYIPNFRHNVYRIKPEMIRYKVGVFKDSDSFCCAAR